MFVDLDSGRTSQLWSYCDASWLRLDLATVPSVTCEYQFYLPSSERLRVTSRLWSYRDSPWWRLNLATVPAVTCGYLFCLPPSERLRSPARRKAREILSGPCTQGIEGRRLHPNLVTQLRTCPGSRQPRPRASSTGFLDGQQCIKYPCPGGFTFPKQRHRPLLHDGTRQRLTRSSVPSFDGYKL
jgi:hypothetical protein